jgi:teichuronic acid biosynthesis glycosyltransferase TuaC
VKVLFVSSGNQTGNPRDVVNNQGTALKKGGVDLDFFCVRDGGLRGYLSALPALCRRLKTNPAEIVHAHYSLCGFLAYFAGARPLIVSLMGSEAYGGSAVRLVTRIFARFFWSSTIVKTREMKEKLGLKNSVIIPNGVDLSVFYERGKKESLARTYLNGNQTNILFVADPGRAEKNFSLARNSVRMLNDGDVLLTPLCNIPNIDLPWFYCAADVVLLTSIWEGSPNVIKEAMACGCPIVSTDVGDVGWVIGSTEGTYIASQNASDISAKLREAIKYSQTTGRTKGRERIKELRLDSESMSQAISSLYEEVSHKYNFMMQR